MADYKVGDEVIVFTRGRRYHKRFTGKVTRVARKYAWAEFEENWENAFGGSGRRSHEIGFDMETGFERGANEFYVRTLEQADQDDRRKAAIALLKDAGIEFKLGHEHFFTLEQVEALAEVTRSWED